MYKESLILKVVWITISGKDFLKSDLLPTLVSFDGINPNSIAILDDCSVHHVSGIVSMITQVGALVYFLPPYSPNLNPIEECFLKWSQLKSMEITSEDDLETHVLVAF